MRRSTTSTKTWWAWEGGRLAAWARGLAGLGCVQVGYVAVCGWLTALLPPKPLCWTLRLLLLHRCRSPPRDAFPLPQDVVELQLLREVAARSASFFQAASQLQGLRGVLCDALGVVGALRKHVGALDADLYSAAVGVAALQRRRGNLAQALEITKVRSGAIWPDVGC